MLNFLALSIVGVFFDGFVVRFFPFFFSSNPWHHIIGFKLNGQLHQVIVARFADENLIIDFDNFVRCLIRLETLFSEYRFKNQTLLLCLFTIRLLDAESCFKLTFVNITDRTITKSFSAYLASSSCTLAYRHNMSVLSRMISPLKVLLWSLLVCHKLLSELKHREEEIFPVGPYIHFSPSFLSFHRNVSKTGYRENWDNRIEPH